MLPFKMSPNSNEMPYPLRLYAVGCHDQHFMERAYGYSAHQLFICKKGNGTFVFKDGQNVHIKANEALLLRKNVPHHYYPTGDSEWVLAFLCFHETFPFIESLKLPTEECFKLDNLTNIYQLIKTIWSYDFHEHSTYRETSASIYNILLLIHEQTVNLEKGIPRSTKEQAWSIVDQVATFINEHYSQAWTVDEIAKQFGYSPQHLNRLFKSFHDCTIHSFIRKVRLERAAILLKEESSLSIDKIAEQIGMDTGYFIRIFHTAYEITPGNYRKRYLNEG